MPEITVLMPVRNGEAFIKESIDSVLCQSFTDFELLIMDDGSTDGTVNIIQSYQDKRIRFEKRNHNFIKNLNEGLSLAQGNYIARMDADDRMHSERLRIQLKRMKQNPDITLCSSWTKPFKTDGTLLAPFQFGEYFSENPILQMLLGNFISHPSVMIKKEFLTVNKLEYQNYPHTEDYKLWFEIAKLGGKIFVEPQHLLYFRVSETQVTAIHREEMFNQAARIKEEILSYLLIEKSNKKLLSLHRRLMDVKKDNLVSANEIFSFFYNILKKVK